jgi:hypothetical protein
MSPARRHDLLPLDGRKPRQEIIDRLTAFKIINEGLNRNARSCKDGCAAQDVRRGRYDALRHGSTLPSIDRSLKALNVRHQPRAQRVGWML